MNKVEIAALRRRLNPDKINAGDIRGCYVSEKGEIISEFNRPIIAMPEEEAEKYLALLRRALSGIPGRNLIEIGFRPDQVAEGEQHALLTAMKDTSLKVDAAVERFYQSVVDALRMETGYLILLICDAYDLPTYDEADSENVFRYLLCAICPVKQEKPALKWDTDDQMFHSFDAGFVVGAPELGFAFPTFEEGGANLYAALYYTRDAAENHPEFIEAVFDGKPPMPAAQQKEAFEAIIGDTLNEDCSLEVVQTVHEQIRDLVEQKKEERSPETPLIAKHEISGMLRECGVPEARVEAFEGRVEEEFGHTDLTAQNIVDVKTFELRTPDVVVKVNPERSDLIQTRVIDGSKYILIRADEGVEVNGVNISIADLGEDVE